MTYYALVFLAGFAGSFHCVGMCGGFACALGRDPRGTAASVLRHFIYNGGRSTTYVFLGGLAGALGQLICTSRGDVVPIMDGAAGIGQRSLAIVAGLLMITMAVQFFGGLPGLHRLTSALPGGGFAAVLRRSMAVRGRSAALALGVFNGFLPCPLVYAFVAQAAGTGAATSGLLVMACFALGTWPAMLLMGTAAPALALRPTWRRHGVRIAGAGILLLGLITLGRGVWPAGLHTGHPA